MALTIAYTLKNRVLYETIKTEAVDVVTTELEQAIKTAASIMAMNNIYYRAIHLAENKELAAMPAQLRMNGLLNPGVPKVDFELFALAASTINGCGMCIHAHVKQVLETGMHLLAVHSVLRIAAVLNSLVFVLGAEEL